MTGGRSTAGTGSAIGGSSGEEGEAAPTPVAVNVVETSCPHPVKLGFHGGQDVLGVTAGATDPFVELVLKSR